MMRMKGFLVGTVLCVAAASASATSVTFNFNGLGSGTTGSSSLVVTSGAYSMEVSARDTSDAVREIYLFPDAGLGITGGTGNNTVGTGEVLDFDLSPFTGDLGLAMVLDVTAGTQTFDLLVDGVFANTFTLTGGPGGVSPPDQNMVDFSPYAVGGSVYSIVAGDGPGITVRSLEVVFAQQVPEPATLLLAMAGLAALTLARRRAVAVRSSR